ncbi:MAG: diaminopimelate decarboxylase, partial [Candidatus Margulisbacteria bacterium]|nr:diaminopimelate decarboxylase [Candidatus Margulisiibacteriota bacterium]
SDVLIKDIYLPPAAAGDLLVVYATGAYNYSMSSNYNQNPRPAMALVNGGQSRILVRRETYDDLLARQEF